MNLKILPILEHTGERFVNYVAYKHTHVEGYSYLLKKFIIDKNNTEAILDKNFAILARDIIVLNKFMAN